ncbi:ABC transporter permease [Tissierella creatinini]|nr:ABC transporter permease [Tissierella creatinini]TJX64577.1 ABC transporter permease [Soehngenia saccharolytica]
MKNKKVQIPQIIICIYLLILLVVVNVIGIPIVGIINESFIKWAMNGVLVLSLVPMINVGAGMNFGMPIGISAGLIGLCIAIELRLQGVIGFITAMIVGSLIAIVFGLCYSKILNRLKGKEEIIGTFAGFSFIPIMNFFWTLVPFKNRQMLYPVGGKGLRPKISLKNYFEGILDNSLVVKIGEFQIPVALILFFLILCFLIQYLYRTRVGHVMTAVSENEKFAQISGVNINKYRTKGIILSTILAAIGICVYSQSYGFVELYDGPFMMAFPAVSAILIGGASSKSATVKQVLIGTYLLQTTYLLSIPVANAILVPEITEVLRMIITNGIILYAFLYKGGSKKYGKI